MASRVSAADIFPGAHDRIKKTANDRIRAFDFMECSLELSLSWRRIVRTKVPITIR